MKRDIAKAISRQTASPLDSAAGWSRWAAFVGLEVHKDTIAVAVAGGGAPDTQVPSSC